MIDYIKNFIKKHNNKDCGFSLLELVVSVGILLVLTVGGLLAYNGIIGNARQAAVNNAADTVYNRAMIYETDDKSGTTFQTAVDDWNKASGILPDEAAVSNIVAGIGVNKEKIIVEGIELDNNAFEIKATYDDYSAIKKSLQEDNSSENNSFIGYRWDQEKNQVDMDGVAELYIVSNGLENKVTDEYNLKITVNFKAPANISNVSNNFKILEQSSDNRTYVLEIQNPNDTEVLSFKIETFSYSFFATMSSDNTKINTTADRTSEFGRDFS